MQPGEAIICSNIEFNPVLPARLVFQKVFRDAGAARSRNVKTAGLMQLLPENTPLRFSEFGQLVELNALEKSDDAFRFVDFLMSESHNHASESIKLPCENETRFGRIIATLVVRQSPI